MTGPLLTSLLGVVAALALGGAVLWRRDIPYATLHDRYGHPGSRHLALPDGTRLHYIDLGRGDGPVLVCLHGYSASSLDWVAWAEHLAHDCRLLLVDLPGHGLTSAPPAVPQGLDSMTGCIAALADALGLDRFVLVGNSMGGLVALTYALANPARVAGLALYASVGGAAEPVAARPPPLAFRLLASHVGRFALRHLDLTPFVRRGLRNAYGDPARVTEPLVRRTTDLLRAPGHRTILTSMQLDGRDPGLLRRLPALRQPALVLIGDADRLVPMAQARAVAAALPASRLVVYPGVGHVPMQEIPARSADDIRGWLAEGAGRDPVASDLGRDAS